MLQVLCAAGVAPADCTASTALDVLRGPAATSPQQCGFLGQAQLARTALAPGPRAYQKIVCTRAPR